MSTATRTDWIWIRHAPVQGQEARYFGRLDVAAEPVHQGISSAIARRLPPVAVWLASPLVRARYTALALRDGVDPVPVADFSEQDYGLWQGRTHNEVYNANRTLDWTEPSAIRPPEGESFADVCDRVREGIERLSAHYAGHTLIAVAHLSTIRAAAGVALGLGPAAVMRIECAPLSVSRFSHRIVNGAAQWTTSALNTEFGLTGT